MREYKTFEQAFIGIVIDIIKNGSSTIPSRNGNMIEMLSYGYRVTDPSSYRFKNESIGRIPYEYAEDFYDWMMSGCTPEQTLKMQTTYKTVAAFLEKPKSSELPDNFNVFYGPRILAQLPRVIKELTSNENSRRAVINILDADDLLLLDSEEDKNLEYPCCDGATVFVRNNTLCMHLHMRSNNMGNVAKLDMYLWGRFQTELAKKLCLNLGHFTSTIVFAHVFTKDIEYFEELLSMKQ